MGEIVSPDLGLLLPVRAAPFNPNLPNTPNEPLTPFEILFTGAWIPDEDPTKIGLQNFADLQNLRYTNSGLEGVQGYTRLTTTPLARPLLRSGLHFVPTIAGVPTSILLVQSFAAAFASSAVYQHLAVIPAAGDFSATPLWTDSAGADLGRFSTAPDGNVVYANGVDTTIWGSTQHRIAAFVNYDDPLATFRYDVTERMLSTSTVASNLVTLARDAGPDIWILVGSTRPIQGIRLVVQNPNTTASTSTVDYWNGSAWTAVGGLVDGTAVAGVSLAQTGSMTFTSTVTTARVKFVDERLLYFYRIKVGATGTPDATIQLSACTVDAPWQPVVDVWDGLERTPIVGAVSTGFGDLQDFTLEILDPSSSVAPSAANLNGIVAGAPLLLGFEERMTALQLRLIADKTNTTVTALTVKYWNGTAWTAVTGLQDETMVGTTSLNRSGAVSWSAPAATSEYTQTLLGRTGYFYQLTWSVTLSATDILLDTVSGIPAQRWNSQDPVPGYVFPFTFAGRIMLAGLRTTGELNRIDYSAVQRPDVWNGDQASDQGKAIFIGDQTGLTSCLELANRFAGNLTALCLAFKHTETFLLQGSAPENFQVFRLSREVGNPAPLSLTLADVPFAADGQVIRTVALWCSSKGPMMTEGSALVPLRFPQPDGSISSVDVYFKDPEQDARGVNTAAYANIRGYYDPQASEYNLLLPSGAGQTTCNAWLVADLRRRRWYRKVPVAYPQMVVSVSELGGATHPFAGLDTGHLLHLDFGATWDGSAVTHLVETADIPYTQSVFDVTQLRYLKLLAVRETGVAAALTCAHAADGSGTFVTEATLALVGGTGRYQKVIQPLNLLANTHQHRLTCVTNDKQRAPRLLGVGFLFQVIRQELSQ